MELPAIIRGRHRLDIQIRFNDFDMFGHLNNNAYLEYFDLAKADYFGDVLGGAVTPERLSVVVANLNVSFYNPTLPGEELCVITRLKSIGHSSLTLEQQVLNRVNGSLKCGAQTVMVGYDVHALSSTAITDGLRSALTRYESARKI